MFLFRRPELPRITTEYLHGYRKSFFEKDGPGGTKLRFERKVTVGGGEGYY